MIAHFTMGDSQAHLWVMLDPKQHQPCALPFLFTSSHPKQLFLFPWMKKILKGKHFADVDEVKTKNRRSTKRHQIDEFQSCFEQWKKHCNRCIASNGEHFEGD